MSKLWLSNGKLVMNADGKFALCDTCPCDGETTPCNGQNILTTLYATFGGYFDFWGTVAINLVPESVGINPIWLSDALRITACESVPEWSEYRYKFGIQCLDDGRFSVFVNTYNGSGTLISDIYTISPYYNTPTSYDPFLLETGAGSLSTSSISFCFYGSPKDFSVTITEVSP